MIKDAIANIPFYFVLLDDKVCSHPLLRGDAVLTLPEALRSWA
jgi:hypothetical protein